MAVTESMRLYPPAYVIGRQAARATEVAGQSIKPGDIFIAPAWVVHRDRRWFEEPEAVLVLATIAQRFRLSLVPGQRITPTPYVTLRPEPGIRMLVARR